MTGIPEWYMRFGDWVLKLLILNILWVVLTLLGLIIFGFFPATVALFAVIRKLVMQDEDVSIFQLFWRTYKLEFVKSNFLGMIVLSIGAILFVDLYILRQLDPSMLNQMLILIVFVLIVVYMALLIYIFPLFVHYDTNIVGYFKYAIILVIGRPFRTIFMLVSIVALMYLLRWIPGLIPIFGLSIFGLIVVKIASMSLPKS
ncbi:YesL family protein [Neobacillus niacini]|uniref:YesL family protein n=1 Tax=Neobacillus niacini TaxID=86668 RepID=UPI002FFED4A6